MDLDSIKDSPVGRLIAISGVDAQKGPYEHYAFLPDPLPNEPTLSPQTWNAVSRATGALGRLRQACIQMPNPGLLIAPALAREAMSTSALEGTYAALPDVLEARLTEKKPGSAEVAEVRAYELIAWEAFRWVLERPITIGLLCDLQEKLSRESQTPPKDPGKVRDHQVFIGPRESSVYEARFVPPPPGDQLRSGLDAWQRWISEDLDLPVALRAAMGHYQFETLHPFGDGNGRIGRLVIVLQLLLDGALPEPALTISPWLLRRRGEYQDHLLRVSQTGDWNPWVTFFCHALSEQAEAHVGVAQQIVQWLADVRQKLNEKRWSGTIIRLAEDLIDWPVVTMKFAAEKYDISVPTAKSAIDRLVEIEVLQETTGGSYNMVFAATSVFELLESL
jgi:Fic family protein